jgi:hypothetical protein
VCGIGEVERECCFNFGSALRTNTTVVSPTTATKHLAKQITNAICTHVAIKTKRSWRLSARPTMAK